LADPLNQSPRGTFLHIRATPKARHDAIEKLVPLANGGLALAVKVTAVPENGKANAAIIALLAKTIGVAKSSFTQVAGVIDRNKVFRIDANQETIAAWLADIAG
jgi:uncharacterized protein